jgi:hypothetical protein
MDPGRLCNHVIFVNNVLVCVPVDRSKAGVPHAKAPIRFPFEFPQLWIFNISFAIFLVFLNIHLSLHASLFRLTFITITKIFFWNAIGLLTERCCTVRNDRH